MAIVRKNGVADVTKKGVADVTKIGVADVRVAIVPTPKEGAKDAKKITLDRWGSAILRYAAK